MITNNMIIRRAMMDDKLQDKDGSQITCEKCKGSKFSGLKIYGKSKQVTTTGAQLLDIKQATENKGKIVSTQYENYIITVRGTYAEGDTDTWRNVRILLDSALAGKTITASLESAENDAGEPLRIICDINYKKQDGSNSWNHFGVDNPTTIAIPAEATSLVCRIHIIENTIDSAEYGTYTTTVKGLMISIGDKVLPWEPYTGGKPSPSPDYPQEIESVGMKWSTGANLVDVHNAIKINTYGLEVTVKDDGTIVVSGTSSSNAKNLSFSFLDNKFSFPLTSIFKLFDVEEKNCKLSSVRRTNASDATNNKIAIDINQINSGNPIYCSFKLVVSEKAVEEYEPYTGGIPKPYGDKIGVNVHGKNLLRIDNSLEKYESEEYAGTANRIISSGMVAIGLDNANLFVPQYISNCVMDNGSISYHTKSPGFAVGIGAQLTSGQTYICTFESTNNGRLCLLYYDANGICLKKQDFVKSTFTVPENVVYTVLLFRDADKAGDYKFWNIKLESGDTATTYEPYRKPQSMDVATPNGLPGIPVASGGNYTDADGQQWICDEVDFARGVYVQNIKVSKSLNDLSWHTWGVNKSANGITGFYTYDIDIPKIGKVVSNIARYNEDIHGGKREGICASIIQPTSMTPYMILRVRNDTISDISSDNAAIQSFKEMLAETDAYMMYVLATPIETPLTDEQIAAYKQLHTYADSTAIISNDANAYMGVTYRMLRD